MSCFLAPSSLHGAGLGLFAARDFKKGEIITTYFGYLRREGQAPFEEQAYSIPITFKGKIYDYIGIHDLKLLQKPGVGLAQMANDALFPCLTGKQNNSYFMDKGPTIVLRAFMDIKKGHEIFVSYGLNYWIARDKKINTFPKSYINLFKCMTTIRTLLETRLGVFIVDFAWFEDNENETSSMGLFLGIGSSWKCCICSKKHNSYKIIVVLDHNTKNVSIICPSYKKSKIIVLGLEIMHIIYEP